MKTLRSRVAAFAAVVLVAACGGGGDAEVAQPTDAEGVYRGMISAGYAFNAIVLDTNEFWALYGRQADGRFTAFGVVTGTGVSGNGMFSSTDVKDYFFTGAVFRGALRANFVPRRSFSGDATIGGTQDVFSSTLLPPAEYIYDTPPSPQEISGVWIATTLQGDLGAIRIGAGGDISGSTGACTVSGAVVPRPGGKNVFDSRLEFAGSACAAAGFSGNGIAVTHRTPEGRSQLLVTAVDVRTSAATTLVSLR